MPKRPAHWCSVDAHTWQRGPAVMLHLPTSAGTQEVLLRSCTRCGQVEVMHVPHRGGEGLLRGWETWWSEPDTVLAGWMHTNVWWDQEKEGQSHL